MSSHTPPRPTRLNRRALLWLAAPLWLGLQACAPAGMNATAASPPAAPLWDTEWRLLAIGDQPVIDGSKATLGFYGEGQAGGNASCNRFFGTLKLERDRMRFGAIGSTKMACVGGASAQEAKYLAALQKAERYERQGDTLLIYVQGMDQPLRFAPDAP